MGGRRATSASSARALAFYLWAFALERTTPTRVASTITVNPVTAATVAALLLGEPIGLHLLVGIAAVCAGIWIASTDRHRRGERASSPRDAAADRGRLADQEPYM